MSIFWHTAIIQAKTCNIESPEQETRINKNLSLFVRLLGKPNRFVQRRPYTHVQNPIQIWITLMLHIWLKGRNIQIKCLLRQVGSSITATESFDIYDGLCMLFCTLTHFGGGQPFRVCLRMGQSKTKTIECMSVEYFVCLS